MKKFFKYAAMAAIAAMFASCTEKPAPTPEPEPDTEKPKVEITEDLAFTLEVTEVEAELAKVKVEHNGTTKDTWYAFATTEADVNKAIAAKVAELTADGGKISGLKKSRSTTVTVRSLEPETDYTFIVFGITSEGELYGTAASTTFKTVKAELKYTENAAWTVEYKGAGVVMDEEYEHTVTVTSTDNNYYFLAAYPVAEFEEYGIKAIAEEEFGIYMEYLNAFNQQYGTDYNMLAYCWQGTATDYIFVDPGVEYYALAIGVGEDGQLNGLWAKSDVIYIEEDEMTPEYAAWLGDWTFTGSNGASYNVTLEKKISNTSYNLYGWDGNDLDEYPVEVSWEADYGLWTIYPQNFGTFEFQDGSKGDIYFLGGQENEQGFSLYTDVPACMGFVAEDGSYNVLGFADEESGIDMTLMCHFVVIDGTPYFWNDPAAVPTFPITVTPAEATASTRSAKKEFKTSKHLSHKLPKVAMFTPEFKAL